MVRVRDQALLSRDRKLHRLEIDKESLWLNNERTNAELLEQRRQLERTTRVMRLVLDTIPVRVYWKDRNMMYMGGNRLFLEDAQMPAEDLPGKFDEDMPWNSRADHQRRSDRDVIENLKPKLDYEEPFTSSKGLSLWLRVSKIPMRDADGKVVGILGTYEDITRRRRTEMAYRENKRNLAQAKEMLQVVLDNIPARVFWKDTRLRYLGGNLLFIKDTGLAHLSELIGKTDNDMVWRQHAGLYQTDDRRVIDSLKPSLDYEEPVVTSTGINWVKTTKVPLLDGSNRVMGILGIYQDITPKKTTELELTKLRMLLGGIIDAIPSMIVGIDHSSRVNQWNREASQVTGISTDAALAKPLIEVLPWFGDGFLNIEMALKDGTIQRGELQRTNDRGDVRLLQWAIYPLSHAKVEGAVLLLDDITERARMEEIMIQTEKMMSVGGLAAGMAHEINNPLAGIVQNAQVIANRVSEKLEKNHQVAAVCGVSLDVVARYLEARDIPSMIQAILGSGRRASQIVNNMLSFSRKGEERFEKHDIRELLDQTLALADNDYDLKLKFDFRNIQIIRMYQSDLPYIFCEGSKIQQVFFNIFKNGAQAMQNWKAPADWQPKFIVRINATNDSLHVEIEDNGPGMERNVRKRVFEPFFTTKPVGVGTGLGLSVSYFIVTENHSGSLGVISSPGLGTCFTLELPLNKKRLKEAALEASKRL